MDRPTDFDIAVEALGAAASAIRRTSGVSRVSVDGDNDSGEIIFTAGKTVYILKLKVFED